LKIKYLQEGKIGLADWSKCRISFLKKKDAESKKLKKSPKALWTTFEAIPLPKAKSPPYHRTEFDMNQDDFIDRLPSRQSANVS